MLLVVSCGKREAPAVRTSAGHYSEKYHYRVSYPPGTEVSPAEGPNAGDEGEFFTVRAGGSTLEGEVSGDPRDGDLSAAERCRRRIELLAKYADYDVAPSAAPPFVISYKAAKEHWYVFSGTRGKELFYEKGIVHDNVMLALRLRYPAAKKDAFQTVVERLAASFQEYLEVTSKAGVMTGEDGEPGLLFLDPLPDEAQN